ncbi:hypothetical protein Tco_0039898 [Tanacetum coccineum]
MSLCLPRHTCYEKILIRSPFFAYSEFRRSCSYLGLLALAIDAACALQARNAIFNLFLDGQLIVMAGVQMLKKFLRMIHGDGDNDTNDGDNDEKKKIILGLLKILLEFNIEQKAMLAMMVKRRRKRGMRLADSSTSMIEIVQSLRMALSWWGVYSNATMEAFPGAVDRVAVSRLFGSLSRDCLCVVWRLSVRLPSSVEVCFVKAGEELIQESSKKQKVDDDKKTTELKQRMEIILDEEEVTIDAIPLVVKSLRIVDWKIHKKGKKSYYQIIRADGKSQMYMIFSQMIKSFDTEDLEDLYKLGKDRYGSTRLVESIDYLLWNDMKIMFEPHVEDEIYMLVEKKYPLTPPTLSMMLEKKLQIDYESEMAYQLLKFIVK